MVVWFLILCNNIIINTLFNSWICYYEMHIGWYIYSLEKIKVGVSRLKHCWNIYFETCHL